MEHLPPNTSAQTHDVERMKYIDTCALQTLRELMASKRYDFYGKDQKLLAQRAYEIADAMYTEREKWL